MFENSSKFPRIFIYILISLSVLIFAGMFFDLRLVEIFYFVALLIMTVFLILDKKYGKSLTNHKFVFLFFDFINLVAVIAVLYYEYSKHNSILNAFLIALICLVSILIFIDILYISDKYSLRREFLIIDVVQLCSMICIFTYFNKVSEFWFAISACVFTLINLCIKVLVTLKLRSNSKKHKNIVKNEAQSNEENVEKLIQSNDEQGEVE